MKSRKQVLKKLFLSTLYLSAFTFGGRYVIVTQHSWLSLQEFADLVAIAEMTPGPIAINAATFVWTRLAGVPGALTATPGCILPSCLLLTLLSRLYLRYRQCHQLKTGAFVLCEKTAKQMQLVGAGLCSARQDTPNYRKSSANPYALTRLAVEANAHIGPAECTVFTGIYGEFVTSQWADRVVGPYNNPSHSL